MNDLVSLVSAIESAAPNSPVRLRQGTIVSVNSDYTATVTIAGSSTQITNVKVASNVCPIPNSTVWLATDGRDWFVISTLAPNGPAWASMRKSTAQSIPDSTWTDLVWSSRTDTANDGVTLSNTGLVCVVPGLYQVTGTIDFVANSTGQRHAILSVNSGTVLHGTGGNASGGSDIQRLRADGLLRLYVGDVVNLTCYQTSGAALNTAVGAGHNVIRMVWVGPAS